MNQPDDLRSIRAAAAEVGVSEGALRKRIKAGDLQTIEGPREGTQRRPKVRLSDVQRLYPKPDPEPTV